MRKKNKKEKVALLISSFHEQILRDYNRHSLMTERQKYNKRLNDKLSRDLFNVTICQQCDANQQFPNSRSRSMDDLFVDDHLTQDQDNFSLDDNIDKTIELRPCAHKFILKNNNNNLLFSPRDFRREKMKKNTEIDEDPISDFSSSDNEERQESLPSFDFSSSSDEWVIDEYGE